MRITLNSSMLLLSIILMDILGGAEVDLFTPSFPELAQQFNLTPFQLEALLSINFIGYFLSLYAVGSLSDIYCRKWIIIIGLNVFITGTLVCINSNAYIFLLLGRFMQGIGVAAPAILCYLIIADLYSLEKQQYLMAILSGFANASVGAAPIVGCYITKHFHWHGNFTALLILAIIVLITVILFVPSSRKAKKIQIIAVDKESTYISKFFIILVVNTICLYTPYWIFVGMSPILYIQDLRVSLDHFGFYQGIIALVFAVGSVSSGIFIKRYNHLKMLYLSIVVFAIGLLCIILVSVIDFKNPLLITLSFLLLIIGSIIPSTIFYPILINYLPNSKGKVTALITGSRLLFSAISLQITGHLYDHSFYYTGLIISLITFVALITMITIVRDNELKQFLN